MPQLQPEVEAFARIRVIGVGGSGINAVNHMLEEKVRAADFIATNTAAHDVQHSPPMKKIKIGQNSPRGLSAGHTP